MLASEFPSLDIWLLNSANVLYVFCYGVRDVLWLRILAVAAMLLLLPYFYMFDMYGCIYWQLVFMAINLFWIILILMERRPPVMTVDQRSLYSTVFKGCCSARDMLRLLNHAEWKDATLGTKLMEKDTEPDQLLLIHNGAATVEVNGQEVAKLGSGDLVGEISFLTQGKTVADVISNGPIKYLSWKRDILEKLFHSKIELKSAIHEVIGRDLVQELVSPHKEIPEIPKKSRFS